MSPIPLPMQPSVSLSARARVVAYPLYELNDYLGLIGCVASRLARQQLEQSDRRELFVLVLGPSLLSLL